jgi:hypothetical protein
LTPLRAGRGAILRAARGACLSASLLAVAAAPAALAHVGSPDTFFQGTAGPYRLRVTVRPPGVVPGLAAIAVRTESPGVGAIFVRPRRFDAGPRGAPAPDQAKPVAGEPNLYEASLWLMREGEYAIEIEVRGSAGAGRTVVPVASLPTRVLPMGPGLVILIAAFAALLVGGGLAIVHAAAKESMLAPDERPGPARRRAAAFATAVATVVFVLVLLGENAWSASSRERSRRGLFRPYRASALVAETSSGRTLRLSIDDPAWLAAGRRPLVPDHGKLVHLFAMREPGLDAFAHLHPSAVTDRAFEAALPPLPAGTYSVFADLTDETGLTQTVVCRTAIPGGGAANAPPSDPDDSWRIAPPIPPVLFAPRLSDLGSGMSMSWEGSEAPIAAGREKSLVFAVRDASGRPVALEPYMGMAAHAAVLRDDGSVFIHLHPMGTMSMASIDAVRGSASGSAPDSMDAMAHGAIPDGRVSFPYAFPKPGPYRLWVQVRARGEVRTGVFDVLVR